jgi:hypothetical protein
MDANEIRELMSRVAVGVDPNENWRAARVWRGFRFSSAASARVRICAMHGQRKYMKNKFAIISSVAGLSALLIVHFGANHAPLSFHPRVIWDLFVGGFALAFLATVLAATNLPRDWRRARVVGRFLWCFAVLAGFAGVLVYGP